MPVLPLLRGWFANRALGTKVVLANVAVLVPAMAILVAYLWQTSRANTIAQSVNSAEHTIQQYQVLRGYYTDDVVAKVQKHGRLEVAHDHHNRTDAIPLPATFILDLGDQYERKNLGVQLKLYSEFPFPERSNRTLDTFARNAIDDLKKNPDSKFVEVEELNGQQTVRVAVADRLISQSCVTCHNTHPASPKKDWRLGDVRGVLEIDTPIGDALAHNAATPRNTALIVLGTVVLMLALMTLLMHLLGRKLRDTVNVLSAVGKGDLTQRLEVDSEDETGHLASGINAMIGKIHAVVQRVRESSIQLLSTASQIAATSGEQGAAMHSLGSSTAEIAAAVQEISATSKELAGTTSEVNDRANQAAALANSGRSGLAGMEGTMQQLVESTASVSAKLALIREKAENINLVITTITKVADQTNLLSINAAIEAEKAGEYGRGFVRLLDLDRLLDETITQPLTEVLRELPP
jgi:methyl-accepting chemotaxis protein